MMLQKMCMHTYARLSGAVRCVLQVVSCGREEFKLEQLQAAISPGLALATPSSCHTPKLTSWRSYTTLGGDQTIPDP